MTAEALAILETQRSIFARLDELARSAPADVDLIVGLIIRHLRSWRPVAVAPLGTLPPPTEVIRDPRGGTR